MTAFTPKKKMLPDNLFLAYIGAVLSPDDPTFLEAAASLRRFGRSYSVVIPYSKRACKRLLLSEALKSTRDRCQI